MVLAKELKGSSEPSQPPPDVTYGILESGVSLPPDLVDLVSTREHGETCFVATVNGEIVGWGFAAVPTDNRWAIGETDTYLVLPKPGVCLTGYVVIESFRGRGIYRQLISYMLDHYAASGVSHAYIWCLVENTPSYKAIVSQGFSEIEIHRRSLLAGSSVQEASPSDRPSWGAQARG